MNTGNPKNHEVLITLSDFFYICKKAKKKILFSALLVACIAVLYTLSKPVTYLGNASFREKGKSQAGTSNNSSLSILLTGYNNNNNSEAISSMMSRTLLEEVAKRLSLQAHLRKSDSPFRTLGNIWNNLYVEYALLSKKQGPLFADRVKVISPTDVSYNGEAPLTLKIRFLTEDTFQVYPSSEGVHNIGTVGIPFNMPAATFTIIRNNTRSLLRQDFILTLNPMEKVVKHLMASLDVDTDREDKTLVTLEYIDDNRHRVAEVLNTMMLAYQDQLRIDQQRILKEQVAYLQVRQDRMQNRLQEMMDEHAIKLSADLAQTGFPNTDHAMKFFASAQQEYTKSLLEIDLELKRLQQVQEDGSSYYDRYVSENGPSFLNQIVTQIRQLKQQADSMELSMRESMHARDDILKDREKVALQFVELTRVRNLSQEADAMLASLEAGEMPDSSLRLYHDKYYMVKNWCDRLTENKDNPAEFKRCVTNFSSYLSNLLHHLHVQEKALQERLTHQQSTPIEFQGVGLNVARELYVVYSKELNEIEAKIRESHYVIEQMKDPEFEISSLSTILHDKVSEGLITRAGTILLQLKDQNNRSEKEQARLKNELELQKGFLEVHLNQSIQLLQLHEKLLREKIQALQSTILGLIQQEVSVLQEHLLEQVKTLISNLLQEKEVLEKHQSELQQEMSKLPSKWVSEKMIEQQTEINKRMVEEITRLVESKNISSNLELIQSAPVDLAIAPIQPRSPRIILFAILGAALGAMLSIARAVAGSLITGIVVTEDNLRLAKKHVAGKLTRNCSQKDVEKPQLDQDLETLRRLAVFLNGIPRFYQEGRVALFITGKGPDYTRDLAHLMSKTGLKILIMPISFDEIGSPELLPGLLQYLEGNAVLPKVTHSKTCDFIASGGVSRFTSELLALPAFMSLLEKFQSEYDWIFAVCHSLPNSSEAENCMHRFSTTIVSIDGETWNDIRACVQITDNGMEPRNLSFVIIE